MEILKCKNGDTIALFKGEGVMIYKRKKAKKNRIFTFKNHKEAKAIAKALQKILIE